MLKAGEADAFSHVAPMLASVQGDLPGARLLPGSYFNVPIAIGVAKGRPPAVADFARTFVAQAKGSGLLLQTLARNAVTGITVAGVAAQQPRRDQSTDGNNLQTGVGKPMAGAALPRSWNNHLPAAAGPQADFLARLVPLIRWRDGKEIDHAADRIPVEEIQSPPDGLAHRCGRWRLGDVGGVRIEAVDGRRATTQANAPAEAAIITPMELMIGRGRHLPVAEYVEPF